MTLQEAILKAIKSYFDEGDSELTIHKDNTERKYSKEYMDKFEEEAKNAPRP